jgi:hypothetical protein
VNRIIGVLGSNFLSLGAASTPVQAWNGHLKNYQVGL